VLRQYLVQGLHQRQRVAKDTVVPADAAGFELTAD
jgi:hypothetical protein